MIEQTSEIFKPNNKEVMKKVVQDHTCIEKRLTWKCHLT